MGQTERKLQYLFEIVFHCVLPLPTKFFISPPFFFPIMCFPTPSQTKLLLKVCSTVWLIRFSFLVFFPHGEKKHKWKSHCPLSLFSLIFQPIYWSPKNAVSYFLFTPFGKRETSEMENFLFAHVSCFFPYFCRDTYANKSLLKFFSFLVFKGKDVLPKNVCST